MPDTYLFYDIETTGLNKAFDQVLRFAAIRTDLDFNELEREEISILLRPDLIPHPLAINTNLLSVGECHLGLSEGDGIKKIHGMLNQPGTISLGYNTLDFDDEFLRFSFFRNLLPPYTHQYANRCKRMDIYPMTVMYYLFRKDILVWPAIDGTVSFKLEALSQQNQLAIGRSHDALVDVSATLELAKRLFQDQSMWSYLKGYFEKNLDQERIEKLDSSFELGTHQLKLALLVLPSLGIRQQCQSPVLYLGNSIPYPNQTLWLRLDLPNLRDTSLETISEETWVVRKKIGEPGFILPPLDRYWSQLDSSRSQLAQENLEWLQSRPELLSEIISYYQEFKYPLVPDLDIDASLYDMGFWSSKEQRWCLLFHHSSDLEKIDLAPQAPSKQLESLAKRYLYRNFPDKLKGKIGQECKEYFQTINNPSSTPPVDYKNQPKLTSEEALGIFKELLQQKDLDPNKQQLLNEWKNYIKNQQHRESI